MLLTAALQWQWRHLEPEEGEYYFVSYYIARKNN
jgi:hypothetical protein